MIPKSIYYFVCLFVCVVLKQLTAMIRRLTQAALVQVWSLVSESPSVMELAVIAKSVACRGLGALGLPSRVLTI